MIEETRSASRAAYAASVLFVLLFASFGLPHSLPFMEIVVALGVLSHVALLPIIAALPAAAWARVGGYAWAAGDAILNVAALNLPLEATGPPASIMALRYGLHVVAAVWLLAVAWRATGAYRAASVVLAIALGGFSFVAPVAPAWALYLVMVLVVLWLAFTGRTLAASPARVATGARAPARG